MGFSFFTDDDIRKLSVQRIISPIAFDQFNNPLRGGLYDPMLGPIDQNAMCPTCGLSFRDCPGHIGHVELCAPVYNPMLFAQLYQVLRMKCFTCHRFRVGRERAQRHLLKLKLAERCRLEEALDLDGAIRRLSGADVGDVSDYDRDRAIADLKRELSTTPRERILPGHARSVRNQLRQAFVADALGLRRCENCGSPYHKVRKVGFTKFFVKGTAVDGGRSLDDEDDGGDGKDETRAGFDDDEGAAGADDAAKSGQEQYLAPLDAHDHAKRLWEQELELCTQLWGRSFRSAAERKDAWRIFFKEVVAVPPCRFRPPQKLGDGFAEHPHNILISKVIQCNERLKASYVAGGGEGEGQEQGGDGEDAASGARRALDLSQVLTRWIALQDAVNCFLDSSKDSSAGEEANTGVRQLLERKAGLFRKHMMGKRVNYACRSVISPDPYIGNAEIGIPQRFARTLAYPVGVTPWNVDALRELVVRGADRYPGANYVIMGRGHFELSNMSEEKRMALGARLLAVPGAVVGRHVRNGDVMLINRQPTLHKPGIMANRVRVLYSPTQQTIRMHYANCNALNADFDGDEINCHLPQDEISRAEAYTIAAADRQYIVPTDGSPLRGLIQDHVDAGVKLCLRDTFFTREAFMQLLHAATTGMPGLEVCAPSERVAVPAPAVLKPRERWTGKQIFSALLAHATRGRPPMSYDGKSKMPKDALGAACEKDGEGRVMVRRGRLLRGVLDKGSFGAADRGLVHAIYELYGAEVTGTVLNGLARMLTYHLQATAGHTCGIEDLLLTSEGDAHRRAIIEDSKRVGESTIRELLEEGGVKADAGAPLPPLLEAYLAEEPASRGAKLDGSMSGALAPFSSELLKACLPRQLVSFPRNSFALMVTTGAKGSKVNQSQISCALGQQALEGRRVPFMASGKTLPCFPVYDPSPRAGGFVSDRFLTGVRPAEYYHHCMAGREGLVDTAVKTSRSGYLQRCLVKHLEELRVHYDHTVRDAEGAVVQFLYGEDGVDPTRGSYMDEAALPFVAMNGDVLRSKYGIGPGFQEKMGGIDQDRLEVFAMSLEASRRAVAAPSKPIPAGAYVQVRRLKKGRTRYVKGSVATGWHGAIIKKGKAGRYTLTLEDSGEVVKKVPEREGAMQVIRRVLPDPLLGREAGAPPFGVTSERMADDIEAYGDGAGAAFVEYLQKVKFQTSLAAPGEAVGSIAAQSVGEPSTQMTLNTFHLAGHGGANVTLGIPRLREIIMTAAKSPKTPLVKLPLAPTVSRSEAEALARRLTRLRLSEILHHGAGAIRVAERLVDGGGVWQRQYHVRMRLQPAESMARILGLEFDAAAEVVRTRFVGKLVAMVRLELGRMGSSSKQVGLVGGPGLGLKAEDGDGGGADAADGEEREGAVGGAGRRGADDAEAMGLDADGAGRDALDFGSDVEDGEGTFRLKRKQADDYEDDDGDDEDDDDDDAVEKPEDGSDGEVPVRRTATTPRRGTPGRSPGIKSPAGAKTSVRVDASTGSVELTLGLPAATPRLLMVNLVQAAAAETTIRAVPGIERGMVLDVSKEGIGDSQLAVQTEGSNIAELWKLGGMDGTLRFNDLMCNDIYRVLKVYGVEACRAAIKQQITAVFGVYGISVDPRHLALIADSMTFAGGYKPMNRRGMEGSTSPFLQMSYETTASFMLDACIDGNADTLRAPSASIVVGQPAKVGTGCMELLWGGAAAGAAAGAGAVHA